MTTQTGGYSLKHALTKWRPASLETERLSETRERRFDTNGSQSVQTAAGRIQHLGPAVSAALRILAVLTLFASAPASAQDDTPMRGIVRAVQQAAFSTETPMRITKLPYREGERFKAGDKLVEFDCRRQRAELGAAKGAAREATLNVASSVHLDQFKAIGRNDVEIARARLDKMQNEVKGLEARVEDCLVVAPFAGRISESPLRPLEFTAPQRSYLSIIDDLNLEIEFIVPSNALPRLTMSMPISFSVDELAHTAVAAHITAIGASVDPVSKTIKVIAAVTPSATGLAVGMSGTASFAAIGARSK